VREIIERVVVDLTREVLELEETKLDEKQREILKQMRQTLTELSMFSLQFVEGGNTGDE
jgi:hypothetical protein